MAEDYDRAVRDVRRRMPEGLGQGGAADPEDLVMDAIARCVAAELIPRPGTLWFFARQSLITARRAGRRSPVVRPLGADPADAGPGPAEHLAAAELLERMLGRARPSERRALLQLAAGARRSEVAAAEGWHHSRLIRLLADCRREA